MLESSRDSAKSLSHQADLNGTRPNPIWWGTAPPNTLELNTDALIFRTAVQQMPWSRISNQTQSRQTANRFAK